MQALKRSLRRALAYSLYYSGILWLCAAIRLRGKAVVLMYHRVLPADADTFSHAGIIVTPRTFDRQMAFLKKHFRVLTPARFAEELAGPAFGRRACLVTFDDGWCDNAEYALPILRAHGVPAVVYVATAYIGSDATFWQERLTRLLCLALRDGLLDAESARELGIAGAVVRDARGARLAARDAVTALKMREPAAAGALLARLELLMAGRAEAQGLGADRFMRWDEVQELARDGLVTIGSHAHTHVRLPTIGYDGAREEFLISKREMARNGIAESATCAYPNGNADDAVAAAARDAGFTLGFVTGGGHVAAGADPMRVRRINIHDADSRSHPEFLYRMLALP